MKKNNNKITVLFLVLCSLFIWNSSYACSCIGKATTKQELKSSDFVFRGTVIEESTFVIDTLFGDEYVYNTKYKFKVQSIYKGKKKYHEQEVIITTGVGNGDCGFKFEKGKEYIVYTNWKNKYYSAGKQVEKFLYTNICKRTTSDTETEETEIEKYIKPCKWVSP
ncbi:hypothetical protein GCM10009118_34330 [Wandonia haliotis]|uniref:Tissue inhibitor of metalloproteinase n=1 Tax=Wandonia haliotis TaxID=574963 RepID=A0ABN1MVH8_9FLAO